MPNSAQTGFRLAQVPPKAGFTVQSKYFLHNDTMLNIPHYTLKKYISYIYLKPITNLFSNVFNSDLGKKILGFNRMLCTNFN